MELCQKQSRLKYTATQNSTEMGYVAHLVRLAEMLVEVGKSNELVKEYLYEQEGWEKFETEFLNPRIEFRKGSLLRENENKNGFLDMFEDNEFLTEE